jgi:hypothetical protein
MRRIAVFCLLAAAVAGAGATTLATDPAGTPGYTGAATFDGSVGSAKLYVDLQYAVYAPGRYSHASADLSGGTDWVYAYQVFNRGTSTRNVTTLVVGLLENAPAGNEQADPDAGALGGIEPDSILPLSRSMLFDFWPEVHPGQHSSVLLFTSPYPPTFGPTSVEAGGIAAQDSAPTPLPEPASVLLVLAGLFVTRRR